MTDPEKPRTPPGGIDWAGIRQRLDQVGRALQDSLSPGRKVTEQMIEQRARLLSERQPEPRRPTELDVLTVARGGDRYAIPVELVIEVVRTSPVTRVPWTPPHLLGLINLRGEVLALFDLLSMRAAAEQPPGPEARVIVLGEDAPELGLLVDEVESVQTIDRTALQPPLGNVAYTLGVTSEGVDVLDARVLLHDPRVAIDDGRGPDEAEQALPGSIPGRV